MRIPGDRQVRMAVGPRPQHLLVIDDFQEIRTLYCDLLAEGGFRVSAYPCDAVDVAMITRLTPDLIVLDGLHPARPVGWSLLRALKLDPSTGEVPIALCTAAIREVKIHAEQLAAMDVRVVLKPFDIDDFLGAILGALCPFAGQDGSLPKSSHPHEAR